MQVSLYTDSDADLWDDLVEGSPMGTFLHTRRFLSYHGTRFTDQSLVFREPAGEVKAVMPAAVDPGDSSCVVSHPGATYGGLVFNLRNAADAANELCAAACEFLRAQGFSRLVYKPVPPHLHTNLCQADLYAIWRRDARLIRRDLWNVIDLGPGSTRSHNRNRTRTVRQARESGVTVDEDGSPQAYEALFDMTTKRLEEGYSTKPVHSLDEMRSL